ncbi:MAG: glycosyltransferase [Chloroflexota bacterium]|nr:glycosyltransferase [Chloroflexota bacterium]
MTKRVLFLMSDTGGGHRAAAHALSQGLHHLHGDQVSCEMVDLLVDYGGWPLNQVPRTYRPLVEDHLWLWRTLWWAGEQPTIWRLANRLVQLTHRGRIAAFFSSHRADLVVSVHPLFNQLPRQGLRRFIPGIPFATVVTDLSSAHPVWYDPDVDLLCASCPEVQRAAISAGVPRDKVHLMGLPVGLEFLEPSGDAKKARRVLGLDHRPTVLLLGGGEGMGKMADTARALSMSLAEREGQLAIICGRNASLRRHLTGCSWPGTVTVHGFVDNMATWMMAADCLVTKAGPGSIAEALVSGLPMVLSDFIPGQETGNVDFVVENGVGVFSRDPREIGETVSRWLTPGNSSLATMRQRAQALARPRASLDIASALSELMF